MPQDSSIYIWRVAPDSATVLPAKESMPEFIWRLEKPEGGNRAKVMGLPYSRETLPGWYWWLYIVAWLAAMVWLKWANRAGFRQFLGGLVQNARLRQFRDDHLGSFWSPFLFVYLIGMLSPWLFLVNKEVLSIHQAWSWYALGIWMMLPILKSWVIGLIGRLFGIESWTMLHRLVSFQSQLLLGLWFFIMMIPDMVDWSTPWPHGFLSGLGLGIVLIYQLFKLATLWRARTFISLIYFLLYLCTLELLPLFWLAKAASIWI